MKEYRGFITNQSWVEGDDGELHPFVEMILLTSEPAYSVDDGGGIVARRVIEQMRFGATMKMLIAMRDALNKTIEGAEQAAAKRRAATETTP